MKVYIDGNFFDKKDAKISVFDHGLLYGDGVFEGIRAYNGRVFKLDEHLDRLFDSAKAVLLNMIWSKDEICEAVLETCRRNELRDGYIRLVITRGEGNLGLSPTRCPKPSMIIIADGLELYPKEFYENGLSIVTASTRRMNLAALNPAIKSLNYLNNVLAKIEGNLAGCQEVLMLNEDGMVAECSGDNIFAVKNGEMFTPPVYAGALGGITRSTVFDLASQIGLPLKECQLTRYDLFVANEIFLTGTGAEVIPVVNIDGREIGDGSVGPWTKRIMEDYHKIASSTGTPIYHPTDS